MSTTRRRAFLTAAIASAAVALVGQRAEARASKIKAHESASMGTTFTLGLSHAPYPAPNGKYNDDSVFVFVPSHFRMPRSGAVDFVVHFHGHASMAKTSMVTQLLREQLRESRQNAILVVPQGPVNAVDGDFGKLMLKRGLDRLLAEVVDVLSEGEATDVLGETQLGDGARPGRVILSAHSGGYRCAAACLRESRVDLREVFLFDALYDEVETFRDWVVADPAHHKLIAYHIGGKTRELGLQLASELEQKGVSVVRETRTSRISRAELTRAKAIFLEGHASHGTAPFEEHALRDCLFASCLRGKGSEKWFAGKSMPRST